MSCRRIVLTGVRAAGKTTLGRAAAAALEWPFRDTDEAIAERVGGPAGEFLAEVGEPEFRRVEQECCLEVLAEPPPAVVALGGGAILSALVRRALAAPQTLTVWLHAPPVELVRRQDRDSVARPRLAGASPEEEVRLVLEARESLYREVAQMRINTFSVNVDASVARILDMM